MTRKTWMVGALCAALLPLTAMAQPGDAPEGMPMHFHRMHGPDSALLAGVTLTDAQRAQIQSIHQSGWTAAKPLMQQLRTTEEQITSALLGSGNVNTTQITALESTASSLRSQLEQQRLSTELQVRNVLTAAQLAQAASTHAQLVALHQQMRSLMHPGAESPAAQ